MSPFSSPTLKNPLILALDTDTVCEAKALVEDIGCEVGALKLGPRLILQDSSLISQFAQVAPIFLDCKFFDIPNSMLSAIRVAYECGVSMVTVHASSGLPTLKLLSDLEKELCCKRPFRILCVTELTSQPGDFQQRVLEHVYNIKSSGLTGVVCSAQEARMVRKAFHESWIVTPGIRLPEEAHDEQARVMTPQLALQAGADAIVIGRPILKAQNKQQAVQRCLTSSRR